MGADRVRRMESHPKADSFFEEILTAQCLTDLWTFVQFGVGYPAKHYHERLHGTSLNSPNYPVERGMCGFLQDWTMDDGHGGRKPVLEKWKVAAREHCKTQIDMAHDVWDFVRDTDERIMLRSHKDPAAKEIVAGVQAIILKPQVQWRFPWLKPATERNRRVEWAADRFKLDREDTEIRTSSYEAYGLGSDPTGGHYTKLKYDDYETKDAAESEPLRTKLQDVYNLDNNLGMGGTRTTGSGTPYHPKAMMAQLLTRSGIFEDRDYDLFVAPCTYEALPRELNIHEPILLDDRCTIRCSSEAFPTAMETLQFCQARVTFFSPVAKDTVVELREIMWNDGQHIRVKRPFPAYLGQPMLLDIGNRKPTAPNRFTLEPQDILSPDLDKWINRKSLVSAKAKQGSTVFAAQMDLKPRDPERMLFHSGQVVVVGRDDVPAGEKIYYRCCDLAGPKRQGSRTSILEGFAAKQGLFISHITLGYLTKSDTLWELFYGVKRLDDLGQAFRETTLEQGPGREEYLAEDLKMAMRDPHEWFQQIGGKHADLASANLEDSGAMPFRIHWLSRGGVEAKNSRIASIEPSLARGDIHVIDGIQHQGDLLDDIDAFDIEDTTRTNDLLDTLADFVRIAKRPRKPKPKVAAKPGREYWKRQFQTPYSGRKRLGMAY